MDPITRMVAAGAAGAAGSSGATYVDDVFSTYLYEGTGSAQSINNGIDLSGEGGLVWIKSREMQRNAGLYDTERGVGKSIVPSGNTGQTGADSTSLNAFNSNGFSVGTDTYSTVNESTKPFTSWTFRKAPGFFDIVTYSGTGSPQNISHSLGSTPGMIIVKCTSPGSIDWTVFHRENGHPAFSNGGSAYASFLNTNAAADPSAAYWDNTVPTSTVFTVGVGDKTNGAGKTYVAYLFAHDDARFGTNEDESIIKCGSFTGTGTDSNPEIDLGFEPQWLMIKNADSQSNWVMIDTMRGWHGMYTPGDAVSLAANLTNAEPVTSGRAYVLPQGFTMSGEINVQWNALNDRYIYMAIRRPNKPPTDATEVFDVGLRSGSSSDAKTNSSILTDMTFVLRKDSNGEYNGISSRLTGQYTLMLNNTSSHTTGWMSDTSYPWGYMTGAMINNGNGAGNTGNLIDFSFKRAPGFFDVVAYRGTKQNRTVDHNLGAVPELMIVKARDLSDGWAVYNKVSGATKFNMLRQYGDYTNEYRWNNTEPTSTVFTIGTDDNVNKNNYNYVAYLFASLDGISKVGSYSGNSGNNIDVDCGFAAGARFVLIKRIDGELNTDGDWYVWNSASGISSAAEPYMKLNTPDYEFTGDDYIDPLSTGFTVTSSAPTALNTTGGTYMFLAIA